MKRFTVASEVNKNHIVNILFSGFLCLTLFFNVFGVLPSAAQELDSPEEAAAMENELRDAAAAETSAEKEPEKKPSLDSVKSGENSKKSSNGYHSYVIFDDKKLLNGYKKKYSDLPKEILLEMIKDYNLNSYKSAAAVMVFNENYASEVVSHEKRQVEKILLRRLARTESPFLETQIMYTLCCLDRYRYFRSMVPGLMQKLDHYNATVNDIAYENLQALIDAGNSRTREARVVFNTLRKMMFLSRRRLAKIQKPGPKLTHKLKLLRWSVKVLGTQELRRLPEEVLHLL